MSRFAAVLALSSACTGTTPGAQLVATSPTPSSPTSPTFGSSVTERFVQQVATADVLFVVDDSGSMADDQASLAAAFPFYLDYFVNSTIDYHIGVVSTNIDFPDRPGADGELVEVGGERWIHPGTADPYGTFEAMVTFQAFGSSAEKGIGATYLALEANADTVNAGFLREGSGLHVIVLSDENDRTSDRLISLEKFVRWMGAMGEDRPATTFTSIVHDADDPLAEPPGHTYMDVTQRVGGWIYDIASVDYTIAMDLLGMETANLDRVFCLSRTPDPATVAVSIETADGSVVQLAQPDDFVVTGEGCVELVGVPPEPGDRIVVDYVPAP